MWSFELSAMVVDKLQIWIVGGRGCGQLASLVIDYIINIKPLSINELTQVQIVKVDTC